MAIVMLTLCRNPDFFLRASQPEPTKADQALEPRVLSAGVPPSPRCAVLTAASRQDHGQHGTPSPSLARENGSLGARGNLTVQTLDSRRLSPKPAGFVGWACRMSRQSHIQKPQERQGQVGTTRMRPWSAREQSRKGLGR